MLLDKSDINLMKVYEIQLKNNPTVVVTRTIAEKILATQRENPAMAEFLGRDGERKFRSLKQLELLDLIFAIGDRSIYKDVLIRTEPQTLKYYRTKINAIYVRGYCGKCHANPRNPAPGLTLFSQLSEAGAYSNLALLRHMENKDGIPLIFPPTPEKSPLFQYGLPPEAARTPHPQVPKLRPFFKNAEDPRYLDWLEWTSLLWGQNENYPVKIMGP